MRRIFPILLVLLLITSCISLEDNYTTIKTNYINDSQDISDEWKLIHYAAAYGSKEEIKAVLEIDDIEIDLTDSKGNTPAIIAVLNDNFDTFSELVKNGCDLTVTNYIGGSAISYIGYFNSENMTKAFFLLSEKDELYNYHSTDGMTLAHYASYGLNIDMLSNIIDLGLPVNEKENLTNLTPIDMTQLTTYKFTDLFEVTDAEYQHEKEYITLLLSNGSDELAELPMSLSIYGNLLFVIYASIDSLFPYQIDLSYINRSEYFTVENINGRECISLNRNEITQMFKDFYYDVEIEVVNSNFNKKIKECSDSEDGYILFANFGNHPYMTQHWANIRNVNDSINYNNYLDVMNPNRLFEGQYFRIQDISNLVAIKFTEIKE